MFSLPAQDNHFQPFVERRDYQLPKLQQALRFCRRFRTALDIGAHCGFFTHNLRNKFSTVHAFEPCVPNFVCLCENVGNTAGVHLHQVALGEAPTVRYLTNDGLKHGDKFNSGGWYLVSAEPETPAYVATVDTLQQQAAEHGIVDIDFVKIDVQGYELPVLKGGFELLMRHKPVIMVELVTKAAGLDVAAQTYLRQNLGMVQLLDMGKDKVYGFPGEYHGA